MSQRKLLQEIDKVFKKVKEGLEIFDGYYEKLQGCESQSQKEKLEGDLKREIKKLQRQRDQIKNWLSGNDVKDKKQLFENRKQIENAMERFKVVEKNMKTKAFSKEGLSMERIDPKEKEKNETSEFLHQMLEELERQIEKFEAEIDQIQTSTKKGKKLDNSKQAQIVELQEKTERNRWHEEKLELILRLLANDDLECEQVNALQEDIKYYVESNEDVDFMEDDTIYDDLNLEDAEEAYGNIGDFPAGAPEDKSEKESPTSNTPIKSFVSPVVNNVAIQPAANNIPKPSAISTPISSIGSISLKPSVTPKNDIRYSSVINAATTSSPQPQTQSQTQPQLNTTTTTSLPSLTPVSTIPSVAASVLPPPPAVDNWSASVIRNQENNNNNNGTPTQTNATLTKTTTNTSISSAVSRELTQSPNLEEKPRSQSILEDLIPNFEKLKKQIQKPLPLEDISKILENSLLNCPDSLDSEKPKTYQPSNPHPTSIYYPLEPTPELFYSAIIGKVDLSTLFYNFYYHQGEYVQLLSAKELVKKGWQYDVKSSKWYQKTEEIQPPSLVNDQIVNSDKRVIWKYFDNDGVWLPRRKDDFDINSVDLRSSF